MRLAPLILLALLAGCGPVVAPKPPPTEALSLSKNLEWGIPGWYDQLATIHGPDVLLVSCHGGTNHATGRWCLFPDKGPPLDAETVGAVLHRLWPNRDIVLLSCNSDGKRIDVPRVFYARKLVSTSPLLPVPGDANFADDFGTGDWHP